MNAYSNVAWRAIQQIPYPKINGTVLVTSTANTLFISLLSLNPRVLIFINEHFLEIG